MDNYIVRAGKLVTVSSAGTIYDGAMVIKGRKIMAVGKWDDLKDAFKGLEVLDYAGYVITPSLCDCHTHLLEYAPGSLYPVTSESHFIGGKAVLLQALSCGITALGEQICGHPFCNFTCEDYKKAVSDIPMDISFAMCSISIGFDPLVHLTSVTGSRLVDKKTLTDKSILEKIVSLSEYPGENIFLNATPANFTEDKVPRAGEIIYTQNELDSVVTFYHARNKKAGVHAAGDKAIGMALKAGIDILHHAHGITDPLIKEVSDKNVMAVATPLGGTHEAPNTPEEIVRLVKSRITTTIATDSYLPPSAKAPWLPFNDNGLKGSESLMLLSQPSMKLLKHEGFDENEILSLITLNAARVLEKADRFGSLQEGLDANFLVAEGVPGLEITDTERIREVFFRGKKVIKR